MVKCPRWHIISKNPEVICQWDHCEALASKHARFGFRRLAQIDGPCGRAVTSMPDHYDLCDDHAVESQDYYLTTAVDELGHCPDGCGKWLLS